MNRLFNVDKKTFVITGGLGHIGLALAKYLIDNDAIIAIVENKNKIEINKVIKKNEYLINKRVKIFNFDISKKNNIKNNFPKIIKFLKKIDILINLAAIDLKPYEKGKNYNIQFHKFPLDIIQKSINVNLIGTFLFSQIVCNHFVEKKIKGNIVNIGSAYSELAPNINLYNNKLSKKNLNNKPINYIISKSSIPNLTRYIATNYARQNIRCNCLMPHGIKNSHDKNFLKRFTNLSPMGRMCEVEEVVGPIIFLCSNSSSYMTGSCLILDGGWSAW